MSETVRAIESFAWEGGMVHDGTELPADAEVVTRFPHFFAPVVKYVGEHGPELVPVEVIAQAKKRLPVRPKKAATDAG